jgi:hypothetical protein
MKSQFLLSTLLVLMAISMSNAQTKKPASKANAAAVVPAPVPMSTPYERTPTPIQADKQTVYEQYKNNNQSKPEPKFDDIKNVIKLSPLGVLLGYYSLEYERALSEKTSVLIGGGYSSNILGIKTGIVSVSAGFNYYLSKDRDAPRGVYIGPRGSALFSSKEASAGFLYSVGGLFGYQIVGKSGFAFDIGIGASYTKVSSASDGIGVTPSAQLAVGYGF